MYTEDHLRRIADWVAVDGWGEASANAAAERPAVDDRDGYLASIAGLTFGDEAIAFSTAQDIKKIHDRVHGVLR